MKNPFDKIKEKLGGEESEKSFAGKIGSFFNPEPQKEKVLRHEDFNAAGDVYYADISVAYKIIGRVLWLFLVFFLVFSMILNYKEITYDNFYYLFKDFSNAVDVNTSDYETLSYDADSRQKFSLYRGGLVAVSPSAVSIYTATGRRTIRDNISYSSPFAVCSDKYVLIYDASGNSFSIYNSFSRIFTEKTEFPITDACFAEDGRFAIVSKDTDSKSVVYIYSKNFKKLAKYSFDSYIFDISMDSESRSISMLYYDAGNGTGRTALMVKDIDSLESKGSLDFDGEFPLGVASLDKDRLAVITDGSVRIIDKNMQILQHIEYFDREMIDFDISEHGIVLSVMKSAQNQIIAFDKSGNLLYNDFILYTVSEIGLSGSYIFINTGNGVVRINAGENQKDEFLPSDGGRLQIYDSNTVLVCGESKAEYLVYTKHK